MNKSPRTETTPCNGKGGFTHLVLNSEIEIEIVGAKAPCCLVAVVSVYYPPLSVYYPPLHHTKQTYNNVKLCNTVWWLVCAVAVAPVQRACLEQKNNYNLEVIRYQNASSYINYLYIYAQGCGVS